MGFNLMKAAGAALEAAPPIGRRRAGAAKGSLSPSARLALVCLANAARDETGLAWPSQATIAGFAGCSVNTIGAALADLAAAGHLSAMPNRAGRFPLYLVHPGGVARYQPVTAKAVRDHLKLFSESEREQALAWLAGLGHIEGPDGAAIIRASAAKSLRRRDKTPPTVGGVPAAHPPPTAAPHPPSRCAPPPQRLWTNLQRNPKRNLQAGAICARLGSQPRARQGLCGEVLGVRVCCNRLAVRGRRRANGVGPTGGAIRRL